MTFLKSVFKNPFRGTYYNHRLSFAVDQCIVREDSSFVQTGASFANNEIHSRDGTGRRWSWFWAGRWGWTSGPLTILLPVGFHRPVTSHPLMLKKPLKFFELKEPLGGTKSELNHLLLLCRYRISRQICFSHMWALRQARMAGTL